MLISIILCTYNRADHLRETLLSLAQVDVPENLPTELLVIDNASTDHTKQVVESCGINKMEVRYIYEPQKGKSNAYNTALSCGRGSIFISTDDDVRFPIDWLEKMTAPILAGTAQAVTGSITMADHLKRPWMTQLHKNWFLDYDVTQVKEPGVLVGANAAFSKVVLEKVPSFDTELGPSGLGYSEDVLFSWQIQQAGFKIASTDSLVDHHFDPSRLSRVSLLNRAYGEGLCAAYLLHHYLHGSTSMPLLKMWIKKILLAFWGIVKRKECLNVEGCPEWELSLVKDISYYQHYLRERKRLPNYEKYGLVKLQRPTSAGSLELDAQKSRQRG